MVLLRGVETLEAIAELRTGYIKIFCNLETIYNPWFYPQLSETQMRDSIIAVSIQENINNTLKKGYILNI